MDAIQAMYDLPSLSILLLGTGDGADGIMISTFPAGREKLMRAKQMLDLGPIIQPKRVRLPSSSEASRGVLHPAAEPCHPPPTSLPDLLVARYTQTAPRPLVCTIV